MPVFSIFILAAMTLISSGRTSSAPAQIEFQGCYIFDRPLGSSASGDLERSDSTWYSLELRDHGIVARPRLHSSYWRREYMRSSSWRSTGDTVHIVVSTGLVGWRIWLVSNEDVFSGVARYVTDVRAAEYIPPRVEVRARKEGCPAARPA